jgi:DNA-binding NarL/FixJ family response regulator
MTTMQVMEPTPTQGPARILVLDDDFGIRTLLEMTLSIDARFELVAATASAAELRTALQLAVPTTVDVVLVDVTLPDANGVELIAELRSAMPHARLALFTGWTDPQLTEAATTAGADAVFTKDGDPSRLLDGIAGLLDD